MHSNYIVEVLFKFILIVSSFSKSAICSIHNITMLLCIIEYPIYTCYCYNIIKTVITQISLVT